MYAIVTATFCVVIALFDLKTYRIPDILLALFFLVMIIMEWSAPLELKIARYVTAVTVLLLFGVVWYFSRGMGLGDVKYAALLGYVLGPDRVIHAFLCTALLGIIIYLSGILMFHWSKTTKIPFAPFLSAGAILALGVP
jgi:prepilin signal peptidase PulO-like enzyme (type II secretory pathway)